MVTKIKLFSIALFIAIVTSIFYSGVLPEEFLSHIAKMSFLGTLGDFIGGITNPLISFFALMYVIKAFDLQKKELEETRNLIQEQALESKKQSEINKRQYIALNSQALLNHTYGQISSSRIEIDTEMAKINFYTTQINNAGKIISTANNDAEKFIIRDSMRLISIEGESIKINDAIELIKKSNANINEAKNRIEILNNTAESYVRLMMQNE